MAIEIEIDKKGKKLLVSEPSSVGNITSGCFGEMKRGVVELQPEEALYLIDVRNAKCADCEGEVCGFGKIMSKFSKQLSMAQYFAYSTWRNRGLIAKRVETTKKTHNDMPVVRYPQGKFEKYKFEYLGIFFPKDLMCLVEDEFAGRKIYENGWFGQYGVYKADKRGHVCKLDAYETLFLQKHGGLELEGSSGTAVMKAAKKRRADFDKL